MERSFSDRIARSSPSPGANYRRIPVEVTPGKAKVVGGLSSDVIVEVFRKHQPEIRYCFERELSKEPELQGEVEVMLIVNGAGAVDKSTTTRDTVGDTGIVGHCLAQRIRRWQFPKPDDGGQVVVTYPWAFRPGRRTE